MQKGINRKGRVKVELVEEGNMNGSVQSMDSGIVSAEIMDNGG